MKTISILLAASLLLLVESKSTLQQEESLNHNDNSNNRTVHFYVLMIPDSIVQNLKRARQEEEGIGSVTETGAYVGQIISGVLGGDVRPIFAGSASFIDEPDVQQGVSTILANVAPSLNNILKSWVNRAQVALGLATTPRPGSVVLNQTQAAAAPGSRPSYGTIAGQSPLTLNEAQRLQTQLQLAQAQLQLAQQQQLQNGRPQTISGSNVVSYVDLYNSVITTVPPLPLIKVKDEDDEESDNFKKVV